MQIKLGRYDDHMIFRVTGSIDRMRSASFLKAMKRFADIEPYMVIDMSQVDFIDSGGIGALVQLARLLRDRGADMWLFHASGDIVRVLENTHVSGFFKKSGNLKQIIEQVAPLELRKRRAVEQVAG